MSIFGLTADQVRELRMIRDEDDGFLARGDQADLCGSGLAKSPDTGMGFYRLTASGLEARAKVIDRFGVAR